MSFASIKEKLFGCISSSKDRIKTLEKVSVFFEEYRDMINAYLSEPDPIKKKNINDLFFVKYNTLPQDVREEVDDICETIMNDFRKVVGDIFPKSGE